MYIWIRGRDHLLLLYLGMAAYIEGYFILACGPSHLGLHQTNARWHISQHFLLAFLFYFWLPEQGRGLGSSLDNSVESPG